jgi:hypothetical protein
MSGPKSSRSKKPKPSFDVAHGPAPETRSGWVYRSDAPPAVIDVHASPGRDSRFEPAAAPPPSERSWFATGFYIMVLPVTLGMRIMFAPVAWIFGSSSKR